MLRAILLLSMASGISLTATSQAMHVIRDTVPIRAKPPFRNTEPIMTKPPVSNNVETMTKPPLRDEDKVRPTEPAMPVVLLRPGGADSIATEKDWEEYEIALADKNKIVGQDPFGNVSNYIDVDRDLGRLNRINKVYLNRTPHVILRQITVSLILFNQLLSRPLQSSTDIQPLNTVIINLKELMRDYLDAVGVQLDQIDGIKASVRPVLMIKNIGELTRGQCYFLSNKSCRNAACRTCLPSMDPCNSANINSIIKEADISYDCGNPRNIDIVLGRYHIFVIIDNKIMYYRPEIFNQSNAEAAHASRDEYRISLE